MNEYQETYEKEISLMDLMFYCLKKWRWIVASMLILAVLAGGYKYQATVKGNALKKEAEALGDDKKEESQEKGVITNPNVEYGQLAVDNTQQTLETMKEYIDSSVVMGLDAYHLNTGILSYYINTDGMSESERVNLLAVYKTFTEDGRLADALLQADDSIEKSELQYLISFNVESSNTMQTASDKTSVVYVTGDTQNESGIFRVQIGADTAERCKVYTEAAEAAFHAYAREVQGKMGAHSLELLSSSQTECVNQSVQDYQTGILNTYSTLYSQFKSMQTDLKNVKNDEGETIVVGEEVVYDNPVSGAVKYAVVGLVLGAFLAAFVLVVLYLMSGKLEGIDDFREEFDMPLLGQVTKKNGKKRLFSFIDSWLVHLQEGAYADITYEEQVKIAASNLKAAARDTGVKKIMLAGTIAKEEAEAFRAELVRELGDLTLSSYERIVFQAAALEELNEYDGILFVEKQGVSYSKMIKKERALAADRDVRILGTVIL